MVMLEIFFFLISLILMPFLTYGEPWSVKLFYLGLCMFLTPIIGIPLYRHFVK
jgi:cytosine/uracil/thiamine/allantoin permease